MVAPYDCVVVHYSEIALKGGNRGLYEEALRRAVARAVADLGAEALRLRGRILVLTGPERAVEAAGRLSTVFGVSWAAPCSRSSLDIEEMRRKAVEVARGCGPPSTFKVEASRDNKEFPMTSIEINRDLGGYVAGALGLRVDLEGPEAVIGVEVLRDQALICCNRVRGPGGLPVGTSGRAIALLSGGIDSPVAAWMVAKRGAEVDLLHLHPYDSFDEHKVDKIIRIARSLTLYLGRTTLIVAPCSPVRARVGPELRRYGPLLLRLFALRLAARIARERGYLAVVTGDSIGQVASQTLHNLSATYPNAGIAVIAPLAGMDKEEIVGLARSIGTYEISIEDYPDCCPALARGHVATRSTAEALWNMYQSAGLDSGIDDAISEAVEITFERRGAEVVRLRRRVTYYPARQRPSRWPWG